MTRYILQRLALLPLLMVIYSFVIFVIIQAPPGDFLTAYVATLASSGSSISSEQIQALRQQYGLDQPMIVQYVLWVQHLLHGAPDLERSRRSHAEPCHPACHPQPKSSQECTAACPPWSRGPWILYHHIQSRYHITIYS